MSTVAELLTLLGPTQVNKADLVALLSAIRNPSPLFSGLRLRTHPSADLAASQVFLDHADVITMDDGERVTDWDDLVANLAAGGAGGLDTGAEAASTWYEVVPIRKSSDGTKGLLFHKARSFYVDSGQQFVTADDAQRALRLATGTATDKLAQGIKFNQPGPVDFINAKLIRAGAVSGNGWFTIETDASGSPSGTVLATSDKFNAGLISTTAQLIRVGFRVLPYVHPGGTAQLHLVLQGDYTRSDTVFIAWRGVAAGGFANGVAKEFNGTVWASASGVGDFNMGGYVRLEAAVTMPSGYDQQARIGWVYNDGSSNLRPFVATGRTVAQNLVDSGAVATAVPTLIDLAAALPPIPVVVRLSGYSSVAADQLVVGSVPDGFAGSLSLGSAAAHFPAANAETALDGVPTEFQGLYVARLAGTGNVQARVKGYEW
jgi:hypothetical protein